MINKLNEIAKANDKGYIFELDHAYNNRVHCSIPDPDDPDDVSVSAIFEVDDPTTLDGARFITSCVSTGDEDDVDDLKRFGFWAIVSLNDQTVGEYKEGA